MEKRRETIELTTIDDVNIAPQIMLETVYDGYYDRIYAYCVHRLFCRAAAEDVTSQIFLAAAEGIHAVTNDTPDAHVRWLYRIAVNQCNAYIRKHLRRKDIFEKFQAEYRLKQDDGNCPPDWTTIYNAIAQLKPIEQTIITLRFFETMEFEAIAAIINKRPNAVRVILHRGLKKLRKMLNAADGGFEDRGMGHE